MIIQRAFVREVLQTSGAVSAILITIFMVVRVVKFLRQASQGDIPIDSVFLLLMLKIITTLDVLLPIVIFVSMLLVLGRWVRDNEMTVITACGISMRQFLPALMTLVLIVGSLVSVFALYLSPLSAQVARSITDQFRARSDVSSITPGVFTETRSGRGVYFVESFDDVSNTYQDIYIYNGGEQQDAVVVANSGYKTVDETTNDEFLILKNGTQYRGNAGDPEYAIVNFETYAIRLKQRAKKAVFLPVNATPTLQLLKLNHRTATGELHWRLSSVAMIPILLLFALCFSSISYRNKRFPGMINALLLYFAYSNMLGLVLALIRRGVVPPHISLWVVHLIFLCLALFFFSRRVQNKPLLPGFSS